MPAPRSPRASRAPRAPRGAHAAARPGPSPAAAPGPPGAEAPGGAPNGPFPAGRWRGGGQCPLTLAVDVIGGKWKPILVHQLLRGTLRFGELRRLVPEATPQMLTLQLRELERDGVVHREVYREVPPKVEYSLTPLGRALGPVVRELSAWGAQYLARRPAAPADAASA